MEHEYFIINRFDHYYDSVNNKGNAFLAISTFSIGGLLTALMSCGSYLGDSRWFHICIVIMLLANFISLVYTLRALFPYTKTHDRSLIYFGTISQLELNRFKEDFSAQKNTQIKEDLCVQIYSLAKGLDKKFALLSVAGQMFFFEAIMLIPLIISLLNNLN